MIRWILTLVAGVIVASIWDTSGLGHAWYGAILAWFILYLCHPGFGQERSGCVHPVKSGGATLTGLLSAFLYGLVIAGGYPKEGYFEQQQHNMDINTTGIVSWIPNLVVGAGRMCATKEVQDHAIKTYHESDSWSVTSLRRDVTTKDIYLKKKKVVDENISRLEYNIQREENTEARLKADYEAGKWNGDEDQLKFLLYKLYNDLETWKSSLKSWQKSAANLETVRSEKGF